MIKPVPFCNARLCENRYQEKALVRELGKTEIFVTHDLQEAFILGMRICLIDKGEIRLVATPEDFQKSDLRLVREYLETLEIT